MTSTRNNNNFNLSAIITSGKNKLDFAGIHPAEREAAWLMEFVLGKKNVSSKTQITENQKNEFFQLIDKRAEHYPLQYLIGNVDFFDTEIQLTTDVLIPRPETEEMVEIACDLLKNIPGEIICADLGTGSGCIPIALAKKLKKSNWFACDVSEAALQVAKKNADKNIVSDKIEFFHGNWFNAFPKDVRFDFIITNPPYVQEGEILQKELDYEPSSALFSGKDGLDDYRIIISNLSDRMNPSGVFLGEFGDGQASALIKIAKENNFENVKIIKDLSGKERFINFSAHS